VNRHHPRYARSAVVEAVDDSAYVLFDFTAEGSERSDDFVSLMRLHTLTFQIESADTATSCTLILTSDEAGTKPLTNSTLSASQTLGSAPDGGDTMVLTYSLSGVYIFTDDGLYAWLIVDDVGGSLANVQATLVWED